MSKPAKDITKQVTKILPNRAKYGMPRTHQYIATIGSFCGIGLNKRAKKPKPVMA
jgi:hypothetical protein